MIIADSLLSLTRSKVERLVKATVPYTIMEVIALMLIT